MNDRELLELAAKAAGIGEFQAEHPCADGAYWNPLTDDGDALRLAVKLALFSHLVMVSGYSKAAIEISNSEDKYAATRRAIVRAAAEIGKSLGVSANQGAAK